MRKVWIKGTVGKMLSWRNCNELFGVVTPLFQTRGDKYEDEKDTVES